GFAGWTFDNSSFMYIWIKSADSKDPASRLNSKTKLHRMGTGVNTDVDFFSSASYPELNIDPSVYPVAIVIDDAKNYVFALLSSSQNEFNIYYAPISE